VDGLGEPECRAIPSLHGSARVDHKIEGNRNDLKIVPHLDILCGGTPLMVD
jgi:hypothetical protein